MLTISRLICVLQVFEVGFFWGGGGGWVQCLGKPVCRPPCFSEVSPNFHLKQFQCLWVTRLAFCTFTIYNKVANFLFEQWPLSIAKYHLMKWPLPKAKFHLMKLPLPKATCHLMKLPLPKAKCYLMKLPLPKPNAIWWNYLYQKQNAIWWNYLYQITKGTRVTPVTLSKGTGKMSNLNWGKKGDEMTLPEGREKREPYLREGRRGDLTWGKKGDVSDIVRLLLKIFTLAWVRQACILHSTADQGHVTFHLQTETGSLKKTVCVKGDRKQFVTEETVGDKTHKGKQSVTEETVCDRGNSRWQSWRWDSGLSMPAISMLN